MLSRTVYFFGAASDLPSTFFCFCNTCLFITFRTSSGVDGPNIMLLYSRMASKFIRYTSIVLDDSSRVFSCRSCSQAVPVILHEPLQFWDMWTRNSFTRSPNLNAESCRACDRGQSLQWCTPPQFRGCSPAVGLIVALSIWPGWIAAPDRHCSLKFMDLNYEIPLFEGERVRVTFRNHARRGRPSVPRPPDPDVALIEQFRAADVECPWFWSFVNGVQRTMPNRFKMLPKELWWKWMLANVIKTKKSLEGKQSHMICKRELCNCDYYMNFVSSQNA